MKQNISDCIQATSYCTVYAGNGLPMPLSELEFSVWAHMIVPLKLYSLLQKSGHFLTAKIYQILTHERPSLETVEATEVQVNILQFSSVIFVILLNVNIPNSFIFW